ncbi:MAG: TIM barrel protein [Acidobacteria bacterium]|nr:TIM barrel protein [Acidobacteriota bacterium]
MDRRTLLALPAAALAKPLPLKLSVRVEAVLPGHPLERQIEMVADAGYQGYEFGDWRAAGARQITALARRRNVACVCLVGNKGVNPAGMGLCDPAERDGFLAEIKASTEAAQRFETSMMVVLSGFRVKHLSRQQQHDSIVEGLKRAAGIVAPRNITMIVEVINTLAPIEPLNPKGNNHADYYLDRTSEAFEIFRKTGSPHVRLLYDLYHVQIMEGNLIETFRAHQNEIAHIHIGDVPGRHEPGTGEIHHPNVFRALRDARYTGYVGMEYVASKDPMRTLRDVHKMVASL